MSGNVTEFRLSGLNQDIPPWAQDGTWSTAENMRFSQGYGRRVGGDKAYSGDAETDIAGLAGESIEHIVNVFDQDGNFWLAGTTDNTNGIIVTDGSTYKDITPAVFTAPTAVGAWTSCTMNGVVILNYQSIYGVYWEGDFATPTVCQRVAANLWPQCKALRAYGQFLVAMNTVDDTSGGGANWATTEETVAWSVVADATASPPIPGTFVAASGNLAGYRQLTGTTGPVIDGIQFRGSFYIGKSDSIWQMTFVGGQNVMSFRRVFSTSGLLARNCFAVADDRLFILTTSDVVETDGTNIRSIADSQVQSTIFSQLGENFDQSFITYHEKERELWVCPVLADNSYCKRAWVFDLDSRKWGQRDFPSATDGASHAAFGVADVTGSNAWSGFTSTDWDTIDQIWNQPATIAVQRSILWAAATDLQLYEADAATESRAGKLERLSIPLPGDQPSVVRRAWPRIQATLGTSVDVSVGFQLQERENVSWSGPYSYTVGTTRSIPVIGKGRFVSIRAEATVDAEWSLTSIGLETVPAGRF